MTTESLIDYIKKELNKNVSKELIISRLSGVGWHMDDIEEGFSMITSNESTSLPLVFNEVKNIYKTDPYHEQVESSSTVSSPVLFQEPKKIEPEKVEIQNNYETSKEEIKVPPKIDQEVKIEIPPKVWIPKAIKPVDNTPSSFITKKLEPFRYELEESEKIPTLKEKPKEDFVPESDKELSSNQNIFKSQPEFIGINNNEPKMENNKEALKQSIVKNEDIIDSVNKEAFVASNAEPVFLNEQSKGVSVGIPKKAMISSYSQDYMSANKLQEEVSQKKKSSMLKWIIIFLVIALLVGGGSFVFLKGYIKFSDISGGLLIKKDPKTILLDNATKFDSITSYKVETEATISLPLFANITSGLMSGGSISSFEKEFFSYKIDGRVNKNNANVSFFDYDISLNSSMLKNEIETNIKSNGVDSFVEVPNLSALFGENTPPEGVVLVPNEKIDQINAIIPENIKEKIDNIDLVKMIPDGSSDLLSNKITSKDLINNFEFIKIGSEKIHDIDTDHYSVSMDNEDLQKILDGILDTIPMASPLEQKTDISNNLKSVSIKSIEFWIGKKDDNIYKYKFSLAIPLSKVLGLEDKSIANSEVSFDLQTTFYDLGIFNQAILPSSFIRIEDFLQMNEDIKIKNMISSFVPLASEMKNALGNYGSKSNTTGSCIKPASGSLFSPLGHTKGASTAVGKIADAMNSIVNKLNGDPQCFSNSKAWALSSPLVSDPNKHFCVDSVGNFIILDQPLSKTVCQ